MRKDGHYTGLVIAGPLAGKRLCHDDDKYGVVNQPAIKNASAKAQGEDIKFQTFVYCHIVGVRWGGNLALDFWVPQIVEENERLTFAFNELVEFYESE